MQSLPQATAKPESLGLLSEAAKSAFLSGSAGLGQVEKRIASTLHSDAEVLADISHYLLALGGKRIRPLLAILCGKLFGLEKPPSALVDAAAGIELIHMATLLHDDIIDRSPVRRRKPSAYLQYGVSQTLLAGDFLFARAFGLCAKLDDFVVTETERAVIELTEGEVLEGKIDPSGQYSLDSYIKVIEKKTASLFSLAAAVGAHIAEANERNVLLTMEFGKNAGIAFQIIDDILDVTADEDLLGKPAGTDLRQKTPSIINILWLETDTVNAKTFFSKEKVSSDLYRSTLETLRHSSVVDDARNIAKRYASKACYSLSELPPDEIQPEVREQLFALIEYTLERCL